MSSSTQPSSLDNHLNESLLIEDERINTHHTAGLYEHDVLLQRFYQDDDKQINSKCENQTYSDYTLDEEIQLTVSNVNEISIGVLKNERKTLPIYQYRTTLIEAIRDHQVLIIQGEAGSGKTTQLPQYLYEEGYCKTCTNENDEAKNQTKKKMMIACTQPHSIAAYVAEEMNVKLGNEVGYSTYFQNCSSDQTIIKYITNRMLLKEYLVERDLASYSVLIIDQADERTFHTDILFGLVKDIVRHRPNFKLLISLTTLTDAVKISQFFDDAPIFSIPGRRFPVDIYYKKAPITNYIYAAVQTILQIHTTQPFGGDILVFLTSQEEIEMAIDMLREANDKQLIILSAYSMLSSDMQTRISETTPPGTRKVILVTNIAEASLTIRSICYVIDSGFCKQKTYDSRNGIESFMIKPISKALANQRAGQAGHTTPGKCFRLYTAETYQHELNDNTIPEIQRINLANVILLLKSLGVNDPFTFNYIDPPLLDKLHLGKILNFVIALEQLHDFGALNDQDELTEIGRRMLELPLDPMVSKTILASEIYKCSTEILTIISMLFVSNSIFYRSKDTKLPVDTIQQSFSSPDGDHLTLLNIYNQWKNTNYSTEWCLENSIQSRSMNRARQIRDQLEHLIKHNGIEIHSNPMDSVSIRKAICAGFFYHTAISVGNGVYKILHHQQNVHIDPDSYLFDQTSASYIIYFELIHSTKEYIRQIIRIEKEWLHETATHFYEKNILDNDK